MKLYELTNELTKLEDLISAIQDMEATDEEKDKEIGKVFEEWLHKKDDFKTKAVQSAYFIRYQEHLSEARRAEAQRMSKLAKEAENLASKLRLYVKRNMEECNLTKIEGVEAKLSLRKVPASLLINVAPEELPTEYTEIVISANKSKIKAGLKANDPSLLGKAEMSTETSFTLVIK